MRFPRVRFTVRRIMVAVAILAVLFGLVAGEKRKERYRRLATFHHRAHGGLMPRGPLVVSRYQEADVIWHGEMAMKYKQASVRPWISPWFSVVPDHPQPARPPEADLWGVEPEPAEPE